jgi:hypothetical protein
MTAAGGGKNHDKPLCGAKKHQGEGTCRRPAGWGTNHAGIGACKLHGGAMANHTKAANRVRAERSVAKFALPADVEPSVALLDSLYRWYGMATYLAGVIAEFENDDALKQLSVGSERYERPSVWVELYREAVKEQAKVAKACLDAGIDERRMRLTEQHGRVLDGVIRKVVDGIFAGLAGAGLRVDALESFRAESLPAIVRGAVMAIAYPDTDALPRGA